MSWLPMSHYELPIDDEALAGQVGLLDQQGVHPLERVDVQPDPIPGNESDGYHWLFLPDCARPALTSVVEALLALL